MKKMIHASGLTGLVFRAFMFLAAAGLYSNAAAPADANAASGEPEEVVRGLRLASDEAAPGYVLYNSRERMNVLLDRAGKVVHSWPVGGTSTSVYLLGNGNLLRCARETNSVFKAGGAGGRLQELSWDGDILWDWVFASERHLLHHDIQPLPNGNILAVAWESKSARECGYAGRRAELTPEAGLWPTMIIEVEPIRPNGGRIVWEWHMWDHLIQDSDPTKPNYGKPSEYPELFDINGGAKVPDLDPKELARLKALGYVPDDAKQKDIRSDFIHTNAIDYNADLDQIAMSSPVLGEIWIIDHSTNSEEAAGHTGGRYGKGGDLLYRWGNPRIYGRGTEEDQVLFGQHDIRWIEKGLPGAGHWMLFNNNVPGADGPHSAILELVPPMRADGSYAVPSQGAFGPEKPVWSYEAPDKKSFHSNFISGASRLPNGNTLICSGRKGRIFEVTREGKIVWEFWEPFGGTHNVFRATKYPPDHPAFAGRDLKPIDPQPEFAKPKPSE
jgi:hypothetical protein